MTQPPVKARNPVAAHPITSAAIAILIIASIFFAVYVPLYARATPKVGPFPFFYFYLLVAMPAVAIVMLIVITLQKRLQPADGGPAAPGGEVTR
jgi:drug/metabolite transporter (DMT)-like permease